MGRLSYFHAPMSTKGLFNILNQYILGNYPATSNAIIQFENTLSPFWNNDLVQATAKKIKDQQKIGIHCASSSKAYLVFILIHGQLIPLWWERNEAMRQTELNFVMVSNSTQYWAFEIYYCPDKNSERQDISVFRYEESKVHARWISPAEAAHMSQRSPSYSSAVLLWGLLLAPNLAFSKICLHYKKGTHNGGNSGWYPHSYSDDIAGRKSTIGCFFVAALIGRRRTWWLRVLVCLRATLVLPRSTRYIRRRGENKWRGQRRTCNGSCRLRHGCKCAVDAKVIPTTVLLRPSNGWLHIRLVASVFNTLEIGVACRRLAIACKVTEVAVEGASYTNIVTFGLSLMSMVSESCPEVGSYDARRSRCRCGDGYAAKERC